MPTPTKDVEGLVDDFRGDNALLVECMTSLVQMDRAGALVPHGMPIRFSPTTEG